MATLDPRNYFAIKDTLARYCMAIDSKNFNLEDFFTGNVHARYPGTQFDGVNDVQSLGRALERALANVTTHHDLTTQTISIADDGKSATATTYFTSWHFGQGRWEGRHLVGFGRYEDSLVLVEGSVASVHGARGKWLVERREVVLTNVVGEMGVMGG